MIRAREREYVDCLSAFRTDSPGDAIAALDEWVCYFAAVADEACEHVRSVQEKVWALDALLEEKAGGLRSGSSAQRILPLLREQPVVTAAFIADHLGVSRVAAHRAVERLVDRESSFLERVDTVARRSFGPTTSCGCSMASSEWRAWLRRCRDC